MSDADELRRLAALGADALDAQVRDQATIAGLETSNAALTALVAELRAQLTPPMLERPAKGPGVYWFEDMRLGVRDALQQVKKLGGGILSFGAGTYEETGFSGEGDASMFAPPGVSIAGRGSAHTYFRAKPGSMSAAHRTKVAAITAPATIPYKVMQLHKEPAAGADYKAHGFTVLGTDQGAIHNGIVFAYTPNLRARDVVQVASRGDLNIPPGETAGITLYRCPDAELWNCGADGIDPDTGEKVSAAMVAINSSPRVKLHDCHGTNSGHSHGLAIYKSPDGQADNFTATGNGGIGGADMGGHVGAGLNVEQCGGWTFTNPRLGGNTLADVRHHSTSGNTPALRIVGAVTTDDQPLTVRMSKQQTTRPVVDTAVSFV